MVIRSRLAARVAVAASLVAASPTAAAQMPDWPSRLVELADISGLSASPDGRFLLFRTHRGDILRNSYQLRWYLLEVADGTIHDLGSGGEPVYDDPGVVRREMPLWPRGSSAAFLRLLDTTGAIGIWRVRPEQRALEPLLVHDGNVEQLALAGGGRALTYATGPARSAILQAEQAQYDQGVRIDETVDLAQALVRGGTVDGRNATQRLVGYWTVRGGLLWNAPRHHHRYDIASGRSRPEGGARTPPPFTPPRRTALATANRDQDIAEASWSSEGGTLDARLAGRRVRCRQPLCRTARVGWLEWRPGAKEVLVGFQDEWLGQTLALWAPARDRLRIVVRSAGLLSGDRHGRSPCGLTGQAAFCVAASAGSPPRLVRVDLADGSVRVLFDPNAGWRSSYRPRIERLSLEVAGTRATGVLLSPSSPLRRAPLFINYYRCEGFLRGGEGDEWPLPALLESGFAVACLNAAPQQLPQNAVATYQTGLAAVRILVDRLAAAGSVDRTRVGMGGFSFGSEVAMWTAVHSDLLAAVSVASAQWEPANYWFSALQGPEVRAMSKAVWGLGAPDETPEAWKRISPAKNAARIHAPVLLQLPEQEARQVPELVVRLRDAGTPTEFIGYPDENHVKVQPRHRLAAYRRNGDWLRYWLQGYRDPEPGKVEQYARWDEMRRKAASTHASPAAQP